MADKKWQGVLIQGDDLASVKIFSRNWIERQERLGFLIRDVQAEELSFLLNFVLMKEKRKICFWVKDSLVDGELLRFFEKSNQFFLVISIHRALKKEEKKVVKDTGFPIKDFMLPPPYKMEEHAESFLRGLFKMWEISVDDKIVSPMVKSLGTDTGYLYFEAEKVRMFLSSVGQTHVDVGVTRGLLGFSGASPLIDFVDALGSKQTKKVVQFGNIIYRREGDYGTMKVIYFLLPSVWKWCLGKRMEGKMPQEDVAKYIGIHPYVWKLKFVPILKKWSFQDLLDLYHGILGVEKKIKEGIGCPWIYLTSTLLDKIGTK